VWAGIGINSDNQSVRWSEAAVARLAAMLSLWWYFYMHGLDRPGPFLKALNQPSAAATYPNGKKAPRCNYKGANSPYQGSGPRDGGKDLGEQGRPASQGAACLRSEQIRGGIERAGFRRAS